MIYKKTNKQTKKKLISRNSVLCLQVKMHYAVFHCTTDYLGELIIIYNNSRENFSFLTEMILA